MSGWEIFKSWKSSSKMPSTAGWKVCSLAFVGMGASSIVREGTQAKETTRELQPAADANFKEEEVQTQEYSPNNTFFSRDTI